MKARWTLWINLESDRFSLFFWLVSSDFTADERMEIESIKMYKKDLLDDIQVTSARRLYVKNVNVILVYYHQNFLCALNIITTNVKGVYFPPCSEVKDGNRQCHGRNPQLWVFRRKVGLSLGENPALLLTNHIFLLHKSPKNIQHVLL